MPPIYPGPAYRIVTQRTIVRCYNPADAALLKEAVDANKEHLLPWMPWAANEPQTIEQKLNLMRMFRGSFDLGQDFTYGIFSPDEKRLLGGTGLHTRPGQGAREIGYWIHKDIINQGYASEVTAALTRVAFEVDEVIRVEIHCDEANVRSAAVPRKLGYTHEATLGQRMPQPDGSLSNEMIWTLFKDDYPQTPCAQAAIEAYDALGRRIL